MLAAVLCLVGGCASSRWLDEHTTGELWNTRGAELPAVKLLGRTPPERRGEAARDAPADEEGEAAARADTALEILIGGFATR